MEEREQLINNKDHELESLVADLTRAFANQTESKEAQRAQQLRTEHEQLFLKSQLEAKQIVKECTVRVKKAESVHIKIPSDSHDTTVSTLTKQINNSQRSIASMENRIGELKSQHEQVFHTSSYI